MRERTVTTALDVLGLLLIAAGVAAAAWQWIGAGALAPAGAILSGVSYLAARQRSTRMSTRTVDEAQAAFDALDKAAAEGEAKQ